MRASQQRGTHTTLGAVLYGHCRGRSASSRARVRHLWRTRARRSEYAQSTGVTCSGHGKSSLRAHPSMFIVSAAGAASMDEQDERLARARARVGTHIHEKFLLRRLLGVGGMAAVYEAQHRNGSRIALKVLHAALDASQHQRKRLLREAYVANTIVHPGAVRIHDDGIDAGGSVY